VPDALGAEIGIDFVDFVTLINGPIGAFGFTHIAIDAFVGNY
jgi:hypothetical protein